MRLHALLRYSVMALGLTLAWWHLGSAVKAAAADATGTWKWSTTFNDNTFETTLKLKQDGEKLTGTISGRAGGQDTEIKDGKIVNGAISFSVVRERNGQTNTTKYAGKLEGDSIKGKIERERNGEKVMTDWEAKRGS
jgi:hypothetical protein